MRTIKREGFYVVLLTNRETLLDLDTHGKFPECKLETHAVKIDILALHVCKVSVTLETCSFFESLY